jgi:hypothetical protein
MLAFPSATRPSEEKGVRRKACGAAYMKSRKHIRAAESPIVGPFMAVIRIFGWVYIVSACITGSIVIGLARKERGKRQEEREGRVYDRGQWDIRRKHV